jgi:hypothetical protein
MFSTDKLGSLTFVVVTQLTYPSVRDAEPDVIRSVFTLDTLTILGIRLNDDSIVPLSHNSPDFGQFLTFHVLAYESLERCTCNLDVNRLFGHMIRPNRKEFERFWVWNTIENAPIKVPPRKVRIRINPLFTFV